MKMPMSMIRTRFYKFLGLELGLDKWMDRWAVQIIRVRTMFYKFCFCVRHRVSLSPKMRIIMFLFIFCFCRNQGAPASSPPSSLSPTPSDLEVRPAKSPCQWWCRCFDRCSRVVARWVVLCTTSACPSGLCLRGTPHSGLCFAGVLINFHSSKFQALDICPF
jgi:hypothetical protein